MFAACGFPGCVASPVNRIDLDVADGRGHVCCTFCFALVGAGNCPVGNWNGGRNSDIVFVGGRIPVQL